MSEDRNEVSRFRLPLVNADETCCVRIYEGTSQKSQTYFKLPTESEERIVELSELRTDEVRSPESFPSSRDRLNSAG